METTPVASTDVEIVAAEISEVIVGLVVETGTSTAVSAPHRVDLATQAVLVNILVFFLTHVHMKIEFFDH